MSDEKWIRKKEQLKKVMDEIHLLEKEIKDSKIVENEQQKIEIMQIEPCCENGCILTDANNGCSVAEGSGTTASGFASHAEGFSTVASGQNAHAEGDSTTASGNFSHAEGQRTTASASGSHAEGLETEARALHSHAEGHSTLASGFDSHAEGTGTTASGNSSHSEGRQTTASGTASHAEGLINLASGVASHAEGILSQSIGESSHAEGERTTANASQAHAEGFSTSASGNASHAEGSQTTASGVASHGEGFGTVASGDASHAEGLNSIASGEVSHAEGFSTTASGGASHAEGSNTIANGAFSHTEGLNTSANFLTGVHVMGKFGAANDLDFSWYLANGISPDSPGIAAKILQNGIGVADIGWFGGGADYAEMFETVDGKPIDVGYFVTLDGKKIREANGKDDYILGVTSVNPAVLADSGELRWKNKYVTDEWGRVQYQDSQPVLNPDWDPTKEYVPRLKRPEWVPVGMIGKLLVRDDGSCQVNGYCVPNDEGIATASTIGYRVMERTGPNQVLILFNGNKLI